MDEHTPRVCPGGGWLVHGARPVPEDPSDWYDPQSGVLVGCNRLSCYRCGADVRSAVVHLDAELDPAGIEALYAADWATVTVLSRDIPQTRLYACRCSVWQAWHAAATLDPDGDAPGEAEPPAWACQGHPQPTLPLDVDGVLLREEADLPALAARVLSGWCPRGGPPASNYFPALWAARVYCRLLMTPLAPAWAQSIVAGLDSDDPRAVGLALHAFALIPRAPGFEALLERAEAMAPGALSTPRRTWYGRTEDTPDADWRALLELMGEDYGVDASYLRPLLMRLRCSTLPLDDLDVRARERVRAAVLASPDALDEEGLGELARGDGEWMARQARAIVRRKRHGVAAVMDALRAARNEEHLLIGATALAAVGAKKRRELAAWLDAMPDEDRPYRRVLKGVL